MKMLRRVAARSPAACGSLRQLRPFATRLQYAPASANPSFTMTNNNNNKSTCSVQTASPSSAVLTASRCYSENQALRGNDNTTNTKDNHAGNSSSSSSSSSSSGEASSGYDVGVVLWTRGLQLRAGGDLAGCALAFEQCLQLRLQHHHAQYLQDSAAAATGDAFTGTMGQNEKGEENGTHCAAAAAAAAEGNTDERTNTRMLLEELGLVMLALTETDRAAHFFRLAETFIPSPPSSSASSSAPSNVLGTERYFSDGGEDDNAAVLMRYSRVFSGGTYQRTADGLQCVHAAATCLRTQLLQQEVVEPPPPAEDAEHTTVVVASPATSGFLPHAAASTHTGAADASAFRLSRQDELQVRLAECLTQAGAALYHSRQWSAAATVFEQASALQDDLLRRLLPRVVAAAAAAVSHPADVAPPLPSSGSANSSPTTAAATAASLLFRRQLLKRNATLKNNSGLCYLKLGDKRQAMALLSTSIEMMMQLGGGGGPERCDASEGKEGGGGGGEGHAAAAPPSVGNDAHVDIPACLEMAASSMRNLSLLLVEQGQVRQALETYSTSAGLLEQLLQAHPSSSSSSSHSATERAPLSAPGPSYDALLSSLAATYNAVGNLLFRLQDLDNALVYLGKFKDIMVKKMDRYEQQKCNASAAAGGATGGSSAPTPPTGADANDEEDPGEVVSAALMNMALLREQQHMLDVALALYNECSALQGVLLDRLVATTPSSGDDAHRRVQRIGLARATCLFKQGRIHKRLSAAHPGKELPPLDDTTPPVSSSMAPPPPPFVSPPPTSERDMHLQCAVDALTLSVQLRNQHSRRNTAAASGAFTSSMSTGTTSAMRARTSATLLHDGRPPPAPELLHAEDTEAIHCHTMLGLLLLMRGGCTVDARLHLTAALEKHSSQAAAATRAGALFQDQRATVGPGDCNWKPGAEEALKAASAQHGIQAHHRRDTASLRMALAECSKQDGDLSAATAHSVAAMKLLEPLHEQLLTPHGGVAGVAYGSSSSSSSPVGLAVAKELLRAYAQLVELYTLSNVGHKAGFYTTRMEQLVASIMPSNMRKQQQQQQQQQRGGGGMYATVANGRSEAPAENNLYTSLRQTSTYYYTKDGQRKKSAMPRHLPGQTDQGRGN